ncbi:MAG: PIN domain-containing protein [Candidatus Acidiferrum sp.]
MDAILDTNSYNALLLSHGRSIFSSNSFVELSNYLRRTKSDLILPGPVFHEIIKKYSDLISGSIKDARDSWETLQRNSMSTLIGCFPPTRDSELQAFQEKLLNLGVGFKVIVLEDYKSVDVKELVRRGVNRVRPANDNGEELRDVVIWLVALEHAKAKNSKVAFITADKHFKGPDGKFHPDLLQDLDIQQVEILQYNSISDFVTGNSLEHSSMVADEIARMLKDEVIANLVTERFKLGKYEDISASNIQFEEAKKYKVGDNSFYVEANYTTVVRYSELPTPLNTIWRSTTNAVPGQTTVYGVIQAAMLQSQPIYSSGGYYGLDQRVPLSSLGSTTFTKNYEAVVNLVLSFRIVSDTSQSVEILQAEIGKNTLISETLPYIAADDSIIS